MHRKKIRTNKKNSRIINTAIIAGTAVIVLVLAFCAIGISASNHRAIYPNVFYGDLELSGMTYNEAVAALDSADINFAKNVTVSVELTEDVSFKITAEDMGLAGSAADAAYQAVNYGKEKGFIGNTFKYIGCVFSSFDLSTGSAASFDEESLKATIHEAAAKANHGDTTSTYTVGENDIIVQKGGPSFTVDETAVYNFICETFKNETEGDIVTDKFSEAVVSGEYTSKIDFDAIYNEVFTEPVNATYDSKSGAAVSGVVGVHFDVAAAKAAYEAAAAGETVTIPLIFTQPETDLSDIEGLLFRDCFVSKTTSMKRSSANRINNITLAAEAMNGKVLLPGETFSYNQCLGKRTAARGYKSAGAYAGGLEVEQIGGGICQGSSTLYYCVLMSELKVVERSNHMFNVSYLPLSIDATVDWGNIDFRFTNNKEYPIKIVAFVENKELTVEIWGTKTDTNVVELKSVHTGTIPYETVEEIDPTKAPGEREVSVTGHKGYTSELYRLVYDENGNLLSETLISKDKYRVRNEIILVGAPSEDVGGEGNTDTGSGETGGSTDTGSGDAGSTDAGNSDAGNTDAGTGEAAE